MATVDYTVGWVCTTVPELEAATGFLDEEHKPKHSLADKGVIFVLGRIGNHNVVIGSTTLQVYGLANASGVATAMLDSFPSLRVTFLVGIGSGVPNRLADIHLGDVVVGFPDDKHDGVIRCTLQHCDSATVEVSVKDSSLRSVPDCVKEDLNSLKYGRGRSKALLERSIEQAFVRNPRLRLEFGRPVTKPVDSVQKTDQPAKNMSKTASAPNLFPDPSAILDEDWETNAVQYSTIACASSSTRRLLIEHELTAQHNILCFETESFNTPQKFPCIVVRGISNLAVPRQFEEYRRWQNYAAMAASAYTAHLLHEIPATKISAAKPIPKSLLTQRRSFQSARSALDNDSWLRALLRKAEGVTNKFRLVQRAPIRVDDHLVNDGFQESCLYSLKESIDSNLRDGCIYSILQSASFSANLSLLDEMLQHGANINAPDDYFGTPLQIAAAVGNLDIVRHLLGKGALVDIRGDQYGNALQAASLQNNVDIVRLLLDHGADVNLQSGFYGNALQAASVQKNLDIVRLLLARGADVDLSGGYHGTALQAATRQNNLDVIQVLLQNEADVTFGHYFQDSSLEIALENRNFRALRLMLLFTTNAKIPGSFIENAIVVASEEGQSDTVKQLLDSGVTIDRQSPAFKAAQSAARERGWHGIARLLAGRGAVQIVSVDRGGSYIDTDDIPSTPPFEKDNDNIFDRHSDEPYRLAPDGSPPRKIKPRGTRYFSSAATQVTGKEPNSTHSELPDHEAISNVLKSNGVTRYPCRVGIHLSRHMLEFYREQVLPATNLSHLVTLTGTPNCAQATSCEDFVEKHWGSDGIQLLNWMAEYLSTQYTHIDLCRLDGAEIDISPFTTEDMIIRIQGSQIRVVSIIQQIMWLTAVLSKASLKRLVTSSMELRPIPFQRDPKSFEITSLDIQSRGAEVTGAEKDNVSSCWHRLFHGAVLASGFAISARSQGKGVEIPFELMVNMANITAIVPREGGSFFLTGQLVTLFPTAKLQDGIQWHAIANDDMEELANISDAPDEIKGIDVRDFCSYRTFLGYYEKAEVLLGTKSYTETNQVRDCGLDVLARRIELVGEGTYSLGVSIKGIVNGTVGGKWSFSKDHEICLSEYRDYFDRLEEAQRQPLIVYDTMTATGWLVSELSMALQLALTYLNSPAARSRYRLQNEESDECEMPTNLPYALPCADGGFAALSVCQRRENHMLKLWNDGQGKSKQFGSYLDDVLKELGALKTAVKAQRLSTGFSIWPLAKEGLRGFDFDSLARRRQGVQHRELQSTGNKASWWGLQHEHGMLVIFGSGFGTVISPSGKTSFPREQPAPYQARLLVASKPCVEAILKKKSGRLCFGTLVWNQPRKDLKECKKGCDGSSCLSIQHLGARPDGPPPKNSIFNTSDAIVFGDVNTYHAVLRSGTISQTWSLARLTLERTT